MSLIEVKNLEKTFHDEKVETPALRGVSFDVDEGEFLAIMGPSGSGKSTLLHTLGFLDRQTKGEYKFDGKTIDEYSDDELAKARNEKMGFIFQTFNLLRRTSVLENVKLPLLYSSVPESAWEEKARKALDSVGLSHRLHHEPSQLSGGERQRVAIARALVNNPKVIFADEPTGNLDSKSGKTVMEIIQKLNEEEGRTVILITHETYTAEHAQRIMKLLDGEIESDIKVDHRHKADDFLK
ncbi:MAG: macrolide ABC transporter ATP-binding protein [Candidatus Colwellbacteria bacterium RIFCSPHIGHO2_02_FULL_43_15]|uniref:Macrolide ABC transporter ATP-binding protein n=1 Tax=Candidatus Colwellbacteria bacterium RIFCSPHIGHO2_02_FULL_43_15 TaxID=1797686 RepID=A0A1G1Z2K8_9BACT|nr:MAG: macrolide ABC transporter ATP-binding protein [Candidatus Colwellbacteria bacterium RIFCSPHIGHO2_02_FULL_43_15]